MAAAFMNSKHKGDVSTSRVLTALLGLGLPVLVPFGDNQRYDLVFEREGKLYKVQVKTGHLSYGAVRFPTSNQAGGGPRRHYVGAVDYFGIYCPDNDETYLVPIEQLGVRGCSLRVDKCRNGQMKGIRYAQHYRI
jgi:hypothetical protein